MVVLEVLGLQILNCSLASFGRRIYLRSYCKRVGGKQKFYGDDSCPNQSLRLEILGVEVQRDSK